MEIVHLFPKAVGLFNLEKNLNEQELIKIGLILKDLEKNHENSISINKSVLDDPDLYQLKEFIDVSIKQFMNEVYCEQTELKITQSWLNRTEIGESHHRHCHPNSYLSGVFYVETTDDDRIMFYNNDPSFDYYRSVTDKYNEVNSSTWWIPTPQNSLILFRSNLHHSVPKILTNNRVSLSFNTFIGGNFGEPRYATFLPQFN